jgi:U3 small nucleolar RNA-associated protein 18
MEICAFNSTGEVLAVAGRRGYVHLVDWKSGAGQVVGSLKMNAGVKSLWWVEGRRGEGRELMSLSDNAEIYVWDVAERRCTRRWQDDGGFGSRIIHGDKSGKYLAIGYIFYRIFFIAILTCIHSANSGFVNVYGSDSILSSDNNQPKPLKAIGNLTTSISSLRFNHDSQLLAIASNTKKDQMRMVSPES